MKMEKKKPVMIKREQDSVVISWKDVESLKDVICEVHLLDDLKQWNVAYWGSNNQFKLEKLAPCTCYCLRIKKENTDKWIEFRVATLDGPYLVMHMTRALKFGKTALLRKIAHSRPILLEVENRNMATPLIQAVKQGDVSLVNLLITLGANVNTSSSHTRRSALMSAVSLGHLSVASLLIDKGCNVDALDINGLNILHHAVDSNKTDSVNFALKQGVNVDSQDHSGWTPLLRAVILMCDEEIVEVLLQHGASKEIKDKNGFDFAKHFELAQRVLR